MTGGGSDGTGGGEGKRGERLAAALRANLHRRKAQARGRSHSASMAEPGATARLQPSEASGERDVPEARTKTPDTERDG